MTLMANTEEQMKVFGYTPEGLDQEVEKYAGEAKKDFEENKLEEERRANHPLNNVPPFQRIAGASTDDVEIPNSDSGVRTFKTKLGTTYNISVDRISTYEAERKKLKEDIINSLKGIKGYLENPSLPSKEQVVDFVKSAAITTLEDIDRMMKGGATYGDIFGYTAGVGAASTPFKVPGGKDSLRIFGSFGAKDYKNEAYYKARELRRRGYTAKQIEEMTGRFTTESPGDYVQQQGIKQEEIFKFEIPDKGIIIKQNDGVINYKEATKISPMLVGDMIPTHKKLFEQYPDLKNVKFYIDPDLGTGAHFNPFVGQLDPNTGKRTGAIVFGADFPGINNVNSPEFRETFFHELQHGTQHQDFLKGSLDQLGGNPTGYTQTITARNPYGDAYQEATILKNSKAVKLKDEIIDLFEKEYLEVGATSVSIKTPSAKVAQKMANLMRDLEAQSFKTYLQTASEVEAGAVGFRAISTSGASQGNVVSEIAKRKKIQTKEEFRRTDKNSYNPRPDSRIEKIFKKITSQFKKMDEIETMRYNEGGVNFAKYALGMDDKLQGFDTFGVKGTYNKGGISMRPEPRPEAEIDVSPRAEAGDQFFVREAERKRAFEKKPKLRPSMDKSFPDVKPKPRPGSEMRTDVVSEEYEIDGSSYDIPVLIFKSGEKIAFGKVLQNIVEKGGSEETNILAQEDDGTMPGIDNLSDRVKKFIRQNNPTREEFETYWYNPRVNKGGLIGEQMQMAFMMNEGGLTDDGMNTDPVSGNEVPSGSMAEEVRDNIPAQLSEGEYVVPADVVRYYGVKFFEDLRDEAKRGLADMEANGRIGGEPVPASGPVNNEELSPQEMQAIQEMMGMAEGGDVQNPYMQQQLLYSQPRPAPIDDQKNTVVGITNPAQNQMPVQNMSSGGQVQGYQNSSVVTNPNTPTSLNQGLEQNFLQQGQQAVNRGFAGFPLGATIFPSEKTGQTALGPVGTQVATTGAIDTAIAGTAGTDTSMLTTVTLYGPNGEIVTLTLPTDQARYDQLISEGYTTKMPVAPPSGGGGGGGGDDDPPEPPDPNAWAEGLDAKNSMDWVKSNLSGEKVGDGFVNNIKLAQNYARSAALANIAEAQGNKDLANQIRGEMAKVYKNSQFIRMMPGEFIDGSSIGAKLEDKIDISGKTDQTPTVVSAVTPKTPAETAASLSEKASQASSSSDLRILQEAQKIAEKAEKSGKTIAEVGRESGTLQDKIDKETEGGGSYDSSTESTGGQGDLGSGSGAGGMNKGGLMATLKKKKKRQPKKGGLAGRK